MQAILFSGVTIVGISFRIQGREARRKGVTGIKGLVLVGVALHMIAMPARSDNTDADGRGVIALPAEITTRLRDLTPSLGHSPQFSIFVHRFRYMGGTAADKKILWFLGTPYIEYDTNAFMPAIVDSRGNWTMGTVSGRGRSDSELLDGIPVLFRQSDDFGFFVTSEWQIEGHLNFLYHSANGEIWVPVELPAPTPKMPGMGYSEAPRIGSLCLERAGSVSISYQETEASHSSSWTSLIGKDFPQTVNWTRIPRPSELARCDRLSQQPAPRFIPYGLVEKTRDGALFDVSVGWPLILIPGPTQ